MTDVLKIADTLGRKEIATALDVGLTAVSNAVVKGRFPPSWYVVLLEMCRDASIDCPPELFQMKSTNSGKLEKSPEENREGTHDRVQIAHQPSDAEPARGGAA